MTTNKHFWNAVEPFLSSKNTRSNNFITTKSNKILIDSKENVTELFNKYFINVVQNTADETPVCIGDLSNPENDSCTLKRIISDYDNNPSIKYINANYRFGNL